MAKAGRIYHWKHGWIPLDATVGVDQKRAELNKRRAARGEAPLLPRKSAAAKGPKVTFEAVAPAKKPRTRKPANWVPPKDNVSTYKQPTAAQRKKLIDAELAKSPAEILAEEKKASDTKLMRKNYSDMSPVEKIRAAEIMYGKNSPKAKAARKTIMAKVMADVLDAEPQADKDAAARRSATYRKVDTVDGVEFVSYKSSAYDPLGSDHGEAWEMDEAQKQVVADAYNEVKAEFPKMQPIQIVATQGVEGILGITTWDGRRISISKNAFSDEQRALAHQNFGDHGAIAGQFTFDPEAFARAVVVHEMGHALEMQTPTSRRRADQLALEKVSATDLGLKIKPKDDVADISGFKPSQRKAPRWSVDTLGGQTIYGLGNQFEWFAEAFAEGWFNGDNATPQGKQAISILKDVYGKKAAA